MIIKTLFQRSILGVAAIGLLLLTATLTASSQTRKKPSKRKVQTAKVLITEQGYSRTSINLRRGVPTRLTFLRKTDATCATEIVIADYKIRKPIPLNVPTVIRFTPKRSGQVGFSCGMNMMRGKLIVR